MISNPSRSSPWPVYQWPQGKRSAFCFTVDVDAESPLLWSLREQSSHRLVAQHEQRSFGPRVGIWRMLNLLDRHKLSSSFAINAALVERCPALMLAIRERDAEVLGHSWSMDTPHVGALDEAQERAVIERALDILRRTFKRDIQGWLSPGRLETARTPDLLRENGIRWFADGTLNLSANALDRHLAERGDTPAILWEPWVNDELPYCFRTDSGPLWALPLPTEIEDRFVVLDNLHAEASWADQVIDAFEFQRAEAKSSGGGRLFSLSLHPWVMGQAHRVKHMDRVLAHINGARDDCWLATPSQIAGVAEAQA